MTTSPLVGGSIESFSGNLTLSCPTCFTSSVVVPPLNGGTGLASPAAHSLLVAEGSSNFNLVTSPAVNGYYVCGFNVIASTGVDPTCALAGIPVNAQSGNYTLTFSDRASLIRESGTATATLTLPQIAGNAASNFPFVTANFNSGLETLSANG